jgi:hypothetical protein
MWIPTVIVMFFTSVLDRSESAVDPDVVKLLKSDALPIWMKERESAAKRMVGTVEWRYDRQVLSGAHLKDNPENLGATFEYRGGLRQDDFVGGTATSMILNNSRYTATLTRSSVDSDWALKDGKWKLPASGLRNDYRESELRSLLTACYPTHQGLVEILADDSRIRQAENVGELVVVECSVMHPVGTALEQVLRLELDPREDWRCVMRSIMTRTERGESTLETKVDAERTAKFGIRARRVQKTATSVSDPTFKQIETWEITDYNDQSPKSAEFFLPFYKIPESALTAFDPPPPSSISYSAIAAGLVVSFVLFIFSYYVSIRRRRA